MKRTLISDTGKSRGIARPIAAMILTTFLISGCSSSDDGDDMDDADANSEADMNADPNAEPNGGDGTATETSIMGNFTALLASRAADYSAGQLERLSIADGMVSSQQFAAAGSDIVANTDGSAYYQLGKFGVDNITRYEEMDLSIPVYQRSVAGDDASANPYQIVFASDTKAYVLRYGSGKIWIIDPSSVSDENFKTGEIDLSAHDVDGVPEMSGGVLVGDRLYVQMERLENFAVVKNGRIAVIDTATDTEVNAGIDLNVRNPSGLQYSEADGMLYVVGRGDYFSADDSAGDRYTGGIDLIDPATSSATLLLDDGSEGEGNNNGFFNQLLVASASKAYVLTYAAFGVNTLREMNTVTGALVDGPVGSFDAIDITTLALDPAGQVWVGMGDLTAPGFNVFDPAAATVEPAFLASTLIPINVVFAQ